MLDNKHIYTPCEPVLEDDIDEATRVGNEMLDYCNKKKLLCLAANQVGYNKQVCVVSEEGSKEIYFNPEIEKAKVECDMFSIDQESESIPMDILSFPKNKVLVDVVNNIKVNAYNQTQDDRIEFTCQEPLSHVWQTVMYILGGVNEQDVVPRDYLTVRRTEAKKKPNDICPGCGRKNKKCRCLGEG